MTKIEKMNQTLEFVFSLFPNAKCELNYTKDYELVIAVMLSAQTTDKSVNKVTPILFSKYDSLEKIANANIKDIEDIIKTIGLYKEKAKRVKEIANYIYTHGGVVPCDEKYLLSMPGVGNKTKNVVMAELYNYPVIAVDTHILRISKRLGFALDKDGPDEVEEKLEKLIEKDKRVKTHHALIHFGRYFCLAKNPHCEDCKLTNICKYFRSKSF